MKFKEYIKDEEDWENQIYELLIEKVGFKNMPKGWTEDSVKKFAKSLTNKAGDQKGFFDACVEKMKKHLDNPEGFCASVKDNVWGTTLWRRGKGKEKSKKEILSSKKNAKISKKNLPNK